MHKFIRPVLLLLLLFSPELRAQATPPATNATGATFAAYPALLNDPDQALPLLRELVGDAGRVVYVRETGRVLVQGLPSAHAAVKAAIPELTAPRRNVRIAVAFEEQSVSTAVGAGVSGGGQVIVTPGGTSINVAAHPRLLANQTTQSSLTRQQILTQSGSEAAIAVGTEIPYLQNLLMLGHQWGYVMQQVEMRQVGASLRVRPIVEGEGDDARISLVLTPEISGRVDGHTQQIRYARVATSVTVANGQTVVIGTQGEHADFYRLFLAGLDKMSNSGNTRILLTVTVE